MRVNGRFCVVVLMVLALVLVLLRPVIRAEVSSLPSAVKVGECVAATLELQNARQVILVKVRSVEGHWVLVEMQDGVTHDAPLWMNFDRLLFIGEAGCRPK